MCLCVGETPGSALCLEKLRGEVGIRLHFEAGNFSLAFDEPPGVLGLWFQDFGESHSQRPAGASARGSPTLLCHER